MTWPGTLLLTASPTSTAQQPTAELWALIQGTQSGLSVPGTVEACGLDLPDFTSALPGETYGVTFANTMWDMLPASAGTITLSNTSTTAAYDSTVNTTLIGIGTTPTSWTNWPSLAVAETDEVDADHNGEWGVTATPKTGTPPGGGGNTYADPPTGIPGLLQPFIRADALYMGLGSVLSLGGNLTSCTAASGNATVTAMDNHIIGCHIAGQPTADAGANYCNSTQTNFLDTNSPHLVPHAATFTAVKMTTAATCANARAAIP